MEYLDPETGVVYLEKVTLRWGDPEPNPPADPTRDGFAFSGWKRTVGANGDVTYEAQWTPIVEPVPVPTPVRPATPFVPQYTPKIISADGKAWNTPKTSDQAPAAALLAMLAAAGAAGVAVSSRRLRAQAAYANKPQNSGRHTR